MKLYLNDKPIEQKKLENYLRVIVHPKFYEDVGFDFYLKDLYEKLRRNGQVGERIEHELNDPFNIWCTIITAIPDINDILENIKDLKICIANGVFIKDELMDKIDTIVEDLERVIKEEEEEEEE